MNNHPLAPGDLATDWHIDDLPNGQEIATETIPALPMVEFLSPSQLRSFEPPEGWNIVGDYHIQRTTPFVIAGPPGTGKSRAATALAIAGATGQSWFGLSVHRRFRTMILQAENGRVRLRNEYAELIDPEFDEWIRVCPPPPLGFGFDQPDFSAQLAAAVAAFQPDVFILDPCNRHAADDKQKDYLAAFNAIRAVLPTGDDAPALGIVAHTRKPQANERANHGRSLLNLLAGSYVLGSVPRAVFVLQPASDGPEDARVVWTCCKNNDGELGERTAWERTNGLFRSLENFNWEDFEGKGEARRTVTEDDLEAVFNDNGQQRQLSTKEACERLKLQTGWGKTACYDALKPDGKFKNRLREDTAGRLSWT